jgi:probable blue pigment (indigoidine) exporter
VNLGGYAYLSLVGTALAYALWFRGLDRLPASSVSLLGQLSPVTATAVGWVALSQRLTGTQLLGAALAVTGVAAGQRAGRRSPVAAVPAPGAESARRLRGCSVACPPWTCSCAAGAPW